MIERVDVEVQGGALATFRIGDAPPGAPLVVAIHGITSSSRTWQAVAGALGDSAALIAPDLRGRARSSELPGPFGLETLVSDVAAVVDHFGLAPAVVVGHSLGAYVAAALAVEHPDRVRSLVLVDGGLTIPGSQRADPVRFVEEFLGPTFQRLAMRFPDAAAYRDWWANHPAFANSDVDPEQLQRYADHDLVGEPGDLHSSVNPEAVRIEGTDLLTAMHARKLTIPAVLLCAPRGMVDDPNPMQPLAVVQQWAAEDPTRRRAVQVGDVNHYTIGLGRRGAQAVADEIRSALSADPQ